MMKKILVTFFILLNFQNTISADTWVLLGTKILTQENNVFNYFLIGKDQRDLNYIQFYAKEKDIKILSVNIYFCCSEGQHITNAIFLKENSYSDVIKLQHIHRDAASSCIEAVSIDHELPDKQAVLELYGMKE